MQVDGDTIIIEVAYDSEEVIRPLLFQMWSTPWYRRISDAPHSVVINFLAGLAVLYFLGLVSPTSVLIAAAAAVFVSAFVNFAVFELLSMFVMFIEGKYRDKLAHVPRLTYRFVLGPVEIRKEYRGDIDILPWLDITTAVETEHDILVSHYSFPKRIFQDFEELAYFKNFIRGKI